MSVDCKALGARIRSIRKQKNISQEKLAEMVFVCTTHISHIETGNTIPSLTTLVYIANALEVSADELLCDSLMKSKDVYGKIYISELRDCSDKEIMMITEVTLAVKQALKRMNAFKIYESESNKGYIR